MTTDVMVAGMVDVSYFLEFLRIIWKYHIHIPIGIGLYYWCNELNSQSRCGLTGGVIADRRDWKKIKVLH